MGTNALTAKLYCGLAAHLITLYESHPEWRDETQMAVIDAAIQLKAEARTIAVRRKP